MEMTIRNTVFSFSWHFPWNNPTDAGLLSYVSQSKILMSEVVESHTVDFWTEARTCAWRVGCHIPTNGRPIMRPMRTKHENIANVMSCLEISKNGLLTDRSCLIYTTNALYKSETA